MLRSTARWRREDSTHTAEHNHDNVSIDDEEGEIMVGMHMDAARRQALERRWNSQYGHGHAYGHSQGRLSRDLEEGFMDDSDEEEDTRRQRR